MKRLAAALSLEKLARHLALLAFLAIVSKASGWTDPSQTSILLLTALAAALHCCSRAAAGRLSKRLPR